MAKAARKKTQAADQTPPVEAAPIVTYKGFDKDLKCRDYQYEIGKDGGNAIFLVHRDDDYVIRKVGAAIVGENGIKPNVWYTLDKNGDFVEA